MVTNNNCACIKREDQAFDIVINTYDCKALVITDLTNWMDDGDSYSIPTKHNVTISLPSKTVVNIDIIPNSTTKVYSKDLSGTECLQDGIYCFKTESCGYKYSRTKAVVCTLRCKLNNFISKSEDWAEITRLGNLIDLIEIDAEMGNEINAQELFKIATKELDKQSCTCTCR
jgi:hypothetical protein